MLIYARSSINTSLQVQLKAVVQIVVVDDCSQGTVFKPQCAWLGRITIAIATAVARFRTRVQAQDVLNTSRAHLPPNSFHAVAKTRCGHGFLNQYIVAVPRGFVI